MSGKVGDLSPEQKVVLTEFRDAVADVLKPEHDDYFLLRWLRARKFDQNKAEIMLRRSIVWRKQIGADLLIQDYKPPEVVTKYIPTGLLGFDKEGSSVRVLPQGTMDFKGLLNSVRKSDLIKSLAQMYEYDLLEMKRNNKKTGRVTETFVFILDYEGFSVKQVASKAVMDVIFELLKVFEANYPERLKTAFVINAPPLFSTLFSAVKPFLAEETRQKFQFFGRDGWKDVLRKAIDPEVLPVYLGGTRVDPSGDPKCPSVIIPGGPIPESYYLKNQVIRRLSEDPLAIQATVEGKALLPVEINVTSAGSVIEWEVETDDFDIGIGLLYSSKSSSDDKSSTEEIIPIERVSCHLAPETGMISCDKAGLYILQLDNSYSKFRQKVVRYKIKIVPPRLSSSLSLDIHSLCL